MHTLVKKKIWENNLQWAGFVILLKKIGDIAYPLLSKLPNRIKTKLFEDNKSIYSGFNQYVRKANNH
jgi:hypothetical protein